MPKDKKKRDRWWIMIRVRAHRRGGIFSPNKKTWIGALGLEPTFELYIDHLCTIYDEVRRVLRPDGCCFVNLGDTYSSTPAGNKIYKTQETTHCSDGSLKVYSPKPKMTIAEKSLCLIPQRFAIEMVNRGWILRNVIVWHKPNPMPSSAKDRFTVDFEQVYFFVKSKKYFFEPIYEPHVTADDNRPGRTIYAPDSPDVCGSGKGRLNQFNNPLGRNKRTVWTIPTQAFSEAHFATFPEKLVEPMILSGCPKEVCSKCGQGRRKVYESNSPNDKSQWPTGWGSRGYKGEKHNGAHTHEITERNFKGYTDCGCKAEYRPGVVLDMFAGSCTTGKVAARLGRDYLMIDLKPEYLEMGERRVTEGETGISITEQDQGQMPLFKE